MKKYKARTGYYLHSDKEAQIVGTFFEEKFPLGSILTDAVVEFAQPKTSPIHKYFEWDDTKAAHEFRLDQARKLIKSIVVEIDGSNVPAYQNIYIENSGRSYLETAQCMETESIWDQVLASALKEAVNWANRYRTYKDLAPAVAAIDEVHKQIKEGKRI